MSRYVVFDCPDCNEVLVLADRDGTVGDAAWRAAGVDPGLALRVEDEPVTCDACDGKFTAKVTADIPRMVEMKLVPMPEQDAEKE